VTGRVPEVHPYYAAADAFISASKAEGHPITVLEAKAAGLPVIAPDIPGVREAVVSGETGILYPSGRTKCLISAMTELAVSEKQHRYGTAGRERVAQHFDVSQMAERYTRLYEQLYRNDR
jgi:glycosyltransferase involved in cell wall biosynthesis